MTSAELRANFCAKIAELEGVIADGQLDKVSALDSDLKSIETEYRAQLQAEIFDACAKEENPMMALTKVHHFQTISHKLDKEDNVVVGVTSIFDKDVDLNPIKFCKKMSYSLVWAQKCEKLAYYLCEDLGARLNVPAETMDLLRKKYRYTLVGSAEQKLGRSPISNNKFNTTLQDIVDHMLFLEDIVSGKKQNSLRVIKPDVEFVKEFFTKSGNLATLTINTVGSDSVAKAVFAVLHRILSKKSYDIKFKVSKKGVELISDANSADEVSATKPDKSKSVETVVVPVPETAKDAAKVSDSEPVETEFPEIDELPCEE